MGQQPTSSVIDFKGDKPCISLSSDTIYKNMRKQVLLSLYLMSVTGLSSLCGHAIAQESSGAQAPFMDTQISALSEESTESVNAELPKILYLIQWQEADAVQSEAQKLKLFSLERKILQPINLTETEIQQLHNRLHGAN